MIKFGPRKGITYPSFQFASGHEPDFKSHKKLQHGKGQTVFLFVV